MAIPNWIIRIEEKRTREAALGLWADLQRARERAQLEFAQTKQGADSLYASTIADAAIRRDRVIGKARDSYDKAKQDLLKTPHGIVSGEAVSGA